MKPKLTTITPCVGRPEYLRKFLHNTKEAGHSRVRHLIVLSKENHFEEVRILEPFVDGSNVDVTFIEEEGVFSLGKWLNRGVRVAETEWVMKMDVDIAFHSRFFPALLTHLEGLGLCDYLNVGMVYLSRSFTTLSMKKDFPYVLTDSGFDLFLKDLRMHTIDDHLPAGSQFVIRKEMYERVGGCDLRFVGYGWEDYQQLYRFEEERLGRDPLPSSVSRSNVADRIKHEISRKRARELFSEDPLMCLLHRWHPSSIIPHYKDYIELNRSVLHEYVQQRKHQRMAQ